MPQKFTYKYPRPALTVDCVVFGRDGEGLKVLLIQRGREPFQGQWALPGGFVQMDETLDGAARRELAEETGIDRIQLEQVRAIGEPLDRDPRERVVTVVYAALIKLSDHPVRAASDAANVRWFPISELPQLAFDHARIIELALERLQPKSRDM